MPSLCPVGIRLNRAKPGGRHRLLTRRWCDFTEAVAGLERFQISQLQWAGVVIPLSGHLSLVTSNFTSLFLHQGGVEEIFCSLLSVLSQVCHEGRDLTPWGPLLF